MRTNRIIENDVDVHEIWRIAREGGFTNIQVATFNPNPFLLSLEDFEAFLRGKNNGERLVSATRGEMQHRRVFFLQKGESLAPPDSRQREGLMCELRVELESNRVRAGEPLNVKAVVKNSGSAVWLPTTARVGAVHFGVHLFDAEGKLLNLDYFRENLTPGEGREIYPGETIELKTAVPMPAAGKYILQFDLVSEAVCWFEHNGAPTVRATIDVV
jgi:hypothetical protein